jgi:hypothetical protein
MKNVFEYLLENEILNKNEFIDHFSIRSIKLNEKIVCDSEQNIKKGDIITIGFRNIIVK